MKFRIAIILITFAVVVGAAVYFENKKPEPAVHIHAGFLVYKDNELQNFSDFRYMHIKPCTQEAEDRPHESKADEQLEKAHLHDMVGNVVHVHRADSKWGDLFKNLGYEVESDAQFYINGERVNNLLQMPITAYDSIVIFMGNNENMKEKVQNRISKERIAEVESMSEGCGN